MDESISHQLTSRYQTMTIAAILDICQGALAILSLILLEDGKREFLVSRGIPNFENEGVGWALIFGGFAYFLPFVFLTVFNCGLSLVSMALHALSFVSSDEYPLDYQNLIWQLIFWVISILYLLFFLQIFSSPGIFTLVIILQLSLLIFGILELSFAKKKLSDLKTVEITVEKESETE